jgi:hypothetical protein
MHRTYELSPLLLIEGISVPISSAQITFAVNQPAFGVFDLVPLKEILDIKPRSFVQFFVRDYAGDNEYKLMYEGEVYGYGFSVQAAGARAFRIETMDISNYWDHSKLRFLDLEGTSLTDGRYMAGVTDGSTQPITTPSEKTNYLAAQLEELLKKYENDPTKAFRDFMTKFGNINEFYNRAYSRYKFPNRVFSASSDNLQKLLQYKLTQELLDGIISTQGGDASFRDIINYFMNWCLHEIVTIPFPRVVNGEMRQFVFKPQPYVMAPPACNVIFPNQYFDMSVNRNFFSEPTRMILKAPPCSLFGTDMPDAVSKLYFAPAFYETFHHVKKPWAATYAGTIDASTSTGVNSYTHGDDTAGKHAYANKAHDFMNFSKEEYMKGIFPAPPIHIPAALQFYIENTKETGDKVGSTKNEIDIMMANSAYYMYYLGRYASRRSTVQGRLNFNAVPGFPVLFIDDQDSAMNVVAVLDSVTHMFSTSGGSTTIYNISHARQTEEKADFSLNSFAEPPIPPWFNENTFGKAQSAGSVLSSANGSAGAEIREEIKSPAGSINNYGTKMDDYYTNLFGCKSATNGTNKSIMEAARYYAKTFNAREDKEAYVRDVTSRKYTSITDAMKFMGARGWYNADTVRVTANYSGGSLTSDSDSTFNGILKDRRAVIKGYTAKLNSNKSFSGS